MSEAAYVTSQVFAVSEQVSVTLLMVVVTVWPFAAPVVTIVIVLSALSSAALRCVPQAADTLEIVGCALSIVTAPEDAEVTWVPALPAESVKSTVIATAPSVSPSATAMVQMWSDPDVE